MTDHDSAGRAASPAGATASLVLFVGERLRPDPAMSDSLARAGMRSLWLLGPEQAIYASQHAAFDALVLDAATEALPRLRSRLACPLLVVGEAADEPNEIDEIVALELGADAYLERPLAPRRLRAQLAALMRLRSKPATSTPPLLALRVRGWSLDRVCNRLSSHACHAAIELTELQACLLQCLFEAGGRIVSRARLAAALPNGIDLEARSVDVYIHRLRRLLLAHDVLDLRIETVRGRGFHLLPGDAFAAPEFHAGAARDVDSEPLGSTSGR